MNPVSLINPPSEAETRRRSSTQDKGRCDAWRKHIFNLTASIEIAAVQQHDRAHARIGLAAVGHLPRVSLARR